MKYEIVYSGPLLFKVKISQEDINSIKKLFIRNKKFKHNKNLASHIDHTYRINDLNSFLKILTPYLDVFKVAYEQWYSKKSKKIDLVQAWVNFMKAGECNPPHIHNQCNFSSVLYTDIPKSLLKENQTYLSSGTKPGDIDFNLYPYVPEFVAQHKCLPKVGDFFIFPARLVHSVSPFKSKGVRVSVAANFVVNNE
tara:strand:- start:309 stop:893 length:585 start_codon:yes stop_codon:yes gene_type:complete